MMQNMGISHNLTQNDRIVSHIVNIFFKVEFTKNVIRRPQDLDFSCERIQ